MDLCPSWTVRLFRAGANLPIGARPLPITTIAPPECDQCIRLSPLAIKLCKELTAIATNSLNRR